MILRFGGHYEHLHRNILNSSSFYYVIEAVKANIFGKELYDTVYKKAAAYAYLIIKDHIFYDGNKRTGCEASFIFLHNNGIEIDKNIDKKNVVCLGLKIENGSLDVNGIVRWLNKNSRNMPKHWIHTFFKYLLRRSSSCLRYLNKIGQKR